MTEEIDNRGWSLMERVANLREKMVPPTIDYQYIILKMDDRERATEVAGWLAQSGYADGVTAVASKSLAEVLDLLHNHETSGIAAILISSQTVYRRHFPNSLPARVARGEVTSGTNTV